MALRITVERVDPGAKSQGDFQLLEVSDRLPVSVIVAEDDTAGVAIATLKKFLGIANSGLMSTTSSNAAANDTLSESIAKVWAEQTA